MISYQHYHKIHPLHVKLSHAIKSRQSVYIVVQGDRIFKGTMSQICRITRNLPVPTFGAGNMNIFSFSFLY